MKADGSGITLKMGGDGTIFYDFERLTALGREATLNQPDGVTPPCAASATSVCDDVIASDVKATFGTPLAGPGRRSLLALQDAGSSESRRPACGHPHLRRPSVLGPSSWMTRARRCIGWPTRTAATKDKTGTYRVERRRFFGSGDVGANWERLESRRAQRIDRGRAVRGVGRLQRLSLRTTPAWTTRAPTPIRATTRRATSPMPPTACSTSWTTRPGE